MSNQVKENSSINISLKAYQQHWSQENYSDALAFIDALLADHPDRFELLWYRCCCLEKLGLHQQALNEVNAKLEEIDERMAKLDQAYEETEDEAIYETQEQPPLVLKDRSLFKLTVQNMPADICKIFHHQLDSDKFLPICDRLIELEANSVELYFERGEYYQTLAMMFDVYDEDMSEEQIEEKINANPDVVRDFSGMAYSKFKLKKALFNFQKAISLESKEPRYYIRAAKVLHLLKRFDEALAMYDEALAFIDKDDTRHAAILQQRRASEDNGKGEHHQMADMLMAGLGTNDMKNRTIEDDAVYAMLKSMEEAIRSGNSMQNALEDLVSDDPKDLIALNIARQIYDYAHEPAMKFAKVNEKEIPPYQLKHISNIEKQVQPLGYSLLAKVEAPNVSATIGQRVVMGIFCSKDAASVIAAFTLKPKWPGKLGFLILLLTGKWRKQKVVNVASVFSNHHYIDTRRTAIKENLSPGPNFHLATLVPGTSISKLVRGHAKRVQKFLAKHPDTHSLPIRTLEDIEKASANEAKFKLKYRQGIQYVTEKELRSMLGKQYKQFADKIRQKLSIMARSDSPSENV